LNINDFFTLNHVQENKMENRIKEVDVSGNFVFTFLCPLDFLIASVSNIIRAL
jgi:hypothetical protein